MQDIQEKLGQKIPDCTEVCDQEREDSCQKRGEHCIPKSKVSLKTMFGIPVGLVFGFVADSLFELFLLLGIFAVYVLLPD